MLNQERTFEKGHESKLVPFYPHLVDIETVKTLPDVALDHDKGEAWLFYLAVI